MTDDAGRPVPNMGASDLVVSEDGSIRSIEVRPAGQPLRVVRIVSHQQSLTGRLLPGARALCDALDGRAEISVVAVIGEGETLSDFSDRVQDCHDALRESGAVIYVASTPRAAKQLTSSLGLAMSQIIDGAHESGGRHVLMSTGNPAAATRQIASELIDSYEIRYAASVDAKPDARLAVSSNRSGARILAPTRVDSDRLQDSRSKPPRR